MNDVDLGVCRSSSRFLKYASLRSKADEGAGLPLAVLKENKSSSSKYNASKRKVAAKYEVKKATLYFNFTAIATDASLRSYKQSVSSFVSPHVMR